ncbi:MAG TPA: hypothetical protein VEA16_23285 [Vicinamibacterales bacterium]|nr:hypothetical protein [Vicinamibacterales bacterium]
MTARRTLFANAGFSAASAVFMLAARDLLYPLFALESSALLVAVAIALLIYAASLVAAARREPPDRRLLLTAAVLDAGWVVGSVIVLIAAWAQLAPVGRVLIIVAAVVVEVFATVQYRIARSLAAQVGS